MATFPFPYFPTAIDWRGPQQSDGESDTMSMAENSADTPQLLHLVFGGEVEDMDKTEFKSTEDLDLVGIYPNYAEAEKAWRSKAQATVDNAHMRYFIVHMHRLLDPESDQMDKDA